MRHLMSEVEEVRRVLVENGHEVYAVRLLPVIADLHRIDRILQETVRSQEETIRTLDVLTAWLSEFSPRPEAEDMEDRLAAYLRKRFQPWFGDTEYIDMARGILRTIEGYQK